MRGGFAEEWDASIWAMDIINAILELAFRPPPRVSFVERFLNHQYILLETDVDEAGFAPDTVKPSLFPGNPNPPLVYNLDGTVYFTLFYIYL